jgi:hypothetical protein
MKKIFNVFLMMVIVGLMGIIHNQGKDLHEKDNYIEHINQENSMNRKFYSETIQKQGAQISQLDEQVRGLKEQVNVYQSAQAIWIPVEVSYYSPAESSTIAANGDTLKEGNGIHHSDYSTPDLFPIGTIFEIQFDNGYRETGIVKDRGALWAIKVFNREDSRQISGATMRLDKYVNSAQGKGVDGAKIRILQWGGN